MNEWAHPNDGAALIAGGAENKDGLDGRHCEGERVKCWVEGESGGGSLYISPRQLNISQLAPVGGATPVVPTDL